MAKRKVKPKFITLFYYTVSGGDGSAYPRFFTTKEARDAYMEAEEESDYFEGFCEADGQIDFAIEADGTIVDAMKHTSPDFFLKYGGKINPKHSSLDSD